MEPVGHGDINTNVDMADPVVNEFKEGVGDVHTDIVIMHDQGENALRDLPARTNDVRGHTSLNVNGIIAGSFWPLYISFIIAFGSTV
jgi:hypothetical protein